MSPTPADIGKAIRLGREKGLDVRHRPQGWSVKTPTGQQTNFWPAQAAEFVRFIERYGTKMRYEFLPADVRVLAEGLNEIMAALGFETDETPAAELASVDYDVERWAKTTVEEILDCIKEELAA